MTTHKLADTIKKIAPPFLVRKIGSLFYGWHGNYSDWATANKKCAGYNSNLILEKVLAASLQVRDGKAAYERDSVTFDKIEYSFPLLTELMFIASKNDNKINILDFGGSLGSTYFQNRMFLETFKEFNWCIVEQPEFVKAGKEHFANNNLHFFYSIDECFRSYNIDVVIVSSVLQYLEKPYQVLDEIFSKNPNYILVDLTRFIHTGKDRLTIQTVAPWIYKAKYCSWFFDEETFLNYFFKNYKLVNEYQIPENINVRSVCKGFFFRKNN
jgi:putative methyltransferase (TIGR04325 family)